ncbi:MAG: 50S ribosomal protein P1 [Candidatus Heimdallarchaeaceae archaeon]
MEYVYAALILHELGTEITEDKIEAILKAAGANVDSARIKALVAVLSDVDIEEALSKAVTTAAPVAVASAASGDTQAPAEEKEAEKKEEEEQEEDLGLGALFG